MAKKKVDALAKWEQEMAVQAAQVAEMEASAGGGTFFGLRGGQLSFNDAPIPGNQMVVIVADSIMENLYYEGKFDPDSMEGPACYAFGRDAASMRPHESIAEPQSETCADCPQNVWGSADTGKGKACGNRRRLALLSAGRIHSQTGEAELEENPSHYETTQLAYLKVPVTSVRAYAALIKQVAQTLHRPPHGVFMKVSAVPDPKSQFKVVFEVIKEVPNSLLPAVMARHDEAKAAIDFPYQTFEDGGEAPAKKGKKGKAKRKY